ncbi:MAG: TIGR01212 family radical SAM protein [Eubacterium sp.]|nr:TIGR01212 family radical SAM protein [Eubacterium sp.]
MRLNEYLQNEFGKKVYKISLNGGFTCPNRDGTKGTAGCIFCSAGGAGEFAEDPNLSITEQIERGKARVAGKYNGDSYIAYFQAFTGTYAPVDRLRALYSEAINHPDIVCLSVATRPDCLPDDVLDLLEEMSRIKPVWVELGLQTIHPETATYIRRGYDLSVYDLAVKKLKQRGLSVIVHVILGLPGESKEDMKDTVSYVVGNGIDGIKLQLLHVLKGTDLEKEYHAGKFQTMEMDTYLDVLADCLAIIPDDVVIHRMTGDGDKKLLVAPLWSADKKRVMNAINRMLVERELHVIGRSPEKTMK